MANIEVMSDSIASASIEQSSGLNQINQAVSQLNQTTQINAATADESAGSSNALTDQSTLMNEAVDSLAMIVLGKSLDEETDATHAPNSFGKSRAA